MRATSIIPSRRWMRVGWWRWMAMEGGREEAPENVQASRWCEGELACLGAFSRGLALRGPCTTAAAIQSHTPVPTYFSAAQEAGSGGFARLQPARPTEKTGDALRPTATTTMTIKALQKISTGRVGSPPRHVPAPPGRGACSIPLLTSPSCFSEQNGVGAFILQCKRMDFHYCDWAGSSKGMKYVLTRLSSPWPTSRADSF